MRARVCPASLRVEPDGEAASVTVSTHVPPSISGFQELRSVLAPSRKPPERSPIRAQLGEISSDANRECRAARSARLPPGLVADGWPSVFPIAQQSWALQRCTDAGLSRLLKSTALPSWATQHVVSRPQTAIEVAHVRHRKSAMGARIRLRAQLGARSAPALVHRQSFFRGRPSTSKRPTKAGAPAGTDHAD
jgi:hypothetical protein